MKEINTKVISFILNGEKITLAVSATDVLLEVLREKAGAKSVKCGCARGDCGTCTVILDGKNIRSCLVLAIEVDGANILTLEGLMKDGLTPLQEEFLKSNAFQCGFCAPGMIVAASDLLSRKTKPTRKEVIEALSGNLCRCTGYSPIIDAFMNLVNKA